MANEAKGQCPAMVNFNRRCIRAEGHTGPCGGGLKSPRVGVYECGFCLATFPTLEEFDAHAPCPAATRAASVHGIDRSVTFCFLLRSLY
jgi:hypothetical protein